MNKLRTLFALLLMALPLPALASPVIADISTYRIDIDANFSGTRLFLFGARNDAGDIVVVIRGPKKDYIVRKKERIGGIWVNKERMKFFEVPNFYYTASSRKLEDIAVDNILSKLGIGQANLLSAPVRNTQNFHDFSNAFLRHQQAEKHYAQEVGTVEFMGEMLFKIAIDFPNNIPPGNYTAEIYLLADGQVKGMQSTPIRVVKSGLDAFIYNAAHRAPALYGIASILIALSAGWLASRIFHKS